MGNLSEKYNQGRMHVQALQQHAQLCPGDDEWSFTGGRAVLQLTKDTVVAHLLLNETQS
jgi:hypothetical protein